MSYDPKFRITPHLIKIIEEISAYRQEIQSATVQVPWVPILQRDAKIRTSHSSTAIEGNPLTLKEVQVLEEGRELPNTTERARLEILNQLAALRFIEKNQSKKTISSAAIFALHKIIASKVMDQGEAGQYRKFGVRVGSYFPPEAKEVPALMKDYLEWWNKKSNEWSPIISSAILHYQFEAIHPFGDGNGRTGRTIALWELYRRGFDTNHIFSVDEVYWEKRPVYYAQLDAVRRCNGDLTVWLEFCAEALHLTLERVLERIQKLTRIHGKKPITLNAKQERLLHLLKESGGLTPRAAWDELKVTRQGAAKIINPLLEAGLIQRVGGKKLGKYIISI